MRKFLEGVEALAFYVMLLLGLLSMWVIATMIIWCVLELVGRI